MILGAGGVAKVTAIKCAQNADVFNEIIIASRTISKCDEIAKIVLEKTGQTIKTIQIDVTEEEKLVGLLNELKPDIAINLVDPYWDLIIMRACLAAGVNYIDTANYEPVEEARLRYDEQWEMHEDFKKAGLMALLGCGFDPGVTNAMTAYAAKHHFSEIQHLHIMDCNAGSHGYAFATNFSPEINIREVTAPARFWQDGKWVEIEPIISKESSRKTYHQEFNYPEIGPKDTFLIFHEELQSLVKNFPTLKHASFGMTFGSEYLTHLRVLQNVGLTGIEPVRYGDCEVVPVKFLERLLPDPSSLAKNYTGKTNIGCIIEGIDKEGKEKKYYIYNICDHAQCYHETGAQGISYTAGVPPMVGAKMMLKGIWKEAGVFNVEQLDPDSFMEDLNEVGLPWTEVFDADVPDAEWK